MNDNKGFENKLDRYRAACEALVLLKDAVDTGALGKISDCELNKRTFDFKRSAALQRTLELQHGLPHRRNLKTAVKDADALGNFPKFVTKCLEVICEKINAARHAKWRKSCSPEHTIADKFVVRVVDGGVVPWSCSGEVSADLHMRTCSLILTLLSVPMLPT